LNFNIVTENVRYQNSAGGETVNNSTLIRSVSVMGNHATICGQAHVD